MLTRALEMAQRRPRMEAFSVDGTGTASIVIGAARATLTDNGTGDYTLTFLDPFARVPMAVGMTKTADSILQTSTISATAVRILAFDATDGTTAKDVDFDLLVVGFDSAEEF